MFDVHGQNTMDVFAYKGIHVVYLQWHQDIQPIQRVHLEKQILLYKATFDIIS